MFSHLLFDFANGGFVALFWPIYSNLYSILFKIKYFGGLKFKIYLNWIMIEASEVNIQGGGDLLTMSGMVVIILLMLVAMVSWIKKR